jgi:hypothetical protein
VDQTPRARGGISPGAILTGVVVAFGAIFLLSAIIGGLLAATGVAADGVTRDDVVNAGIAGGVAFLIAQFLAYLWGGYTAGRMGRGAGLANGVLVAFVAILLGVIVIAIAAALGASAELNMPFSTARLPLEENYAVEFGTGVGIALLGVMFLGGAVGGMLGARWHTKLERRAIEEVEGRHISEGRPAETTETRPREPAETTETRPREPAAPPPARGPSQEARVSQPRT